MGRYRCEARSASAFVQQLAVSYVRNGYRFYVTGVIPKRKDPRAVDRKLIEQYRIDISPTSRVRRKELRLANVHYLRHQDFFILIATEGEHAFYTLEGRDRIRDIKDEPVKFSGYSVGFRRKRRKRQGAGKGHGPVSWHASVRIEQGEYLRLRSYFLDLAVHRSVENLVSEFQALPYQAYAPVRSQLLNLLRAVNRHRRAAGFDLVPLSALRLRRRSVRVFVEDEEQEDELNKPPIASTSLPRSGGKATHDS